MCFVTKAMSISNMTKAMTGVIMNYNLLTVCHVAWYSSRRRLAGELNQYI